MTVAGRETTRKGQGQPRGGGRSGLLARGCAVGVKGCSQQVECALAEALVLFSDTLQGEWESAGNCGRKGVQGMRLFQGSFSTLIWLYRVCDFELLFSFFSSHFSQLISPLHCHLIYIFI